MPGSKMLRLRNVRSVVERGEFSPSMPEISRTPIPCAHTKTMMGDFGKGRENKRRGENGQGEIQSEKVTPANVWQARSQTLCSSDSLWSSLTA